MKAAVIFPPNPETRTIAAGAFKATCLALLNEADLRENPIAVTKHGRVVAHVVAPPAQMPFRSIVGRSPGIKAPSEKEWAKMKEEWSDEWHASFERRAAILNETPKKRKRG